AIVDPVSGIGADVTTHVLAANQAQPRRDHNPSLPGAQYDVRACTDSTQGSAELFLSVAGDPPRSAGSVAIAPAKLSDNCPAGLGFVALFSGVTLPESLEGASGDLATATRLSVTVTDASTELGSSPSVDVWVDSEAPTTVPWYPAPICGYTFSR